MNRQLTITSFTDPACTWCWGNEAELRALAFMFKDRLHIKYVMGGLVRNIYAFRDASNGIGDGPIETINQSIADHWLEATARHKMPVDVKGFALFGPDHPSTWPMNIAYKAALNQGEEHANRFLRRMREAIATEAKQANKLDVLIEIASEVGLDIGAFIIDYQDPKTTQAFYKDLGLNGRYGITGFPAYLIEYGDKQLVIKGYQTLSSFVEIIKYVTANQVTAEILQLNKENLLTFLATHKQTAQHEISVAFAVSNQEVEVVINQLVNDGYVAQKPIGNSFFYSLTTSGMTCDITTGLCS